MKQDVHLLAAALTRVARVRVPDTTGIKGKEVEGGKGGYKFEFNEAHLSFLGLPTYAPAPLWEMWVRGRELKDSVD